MTTPITAIPMVRGCRTAKRSISAPRRARPAAIPAMNTLTTPTRTVTANVTIAVQLFPLTVTWDAGSNGGTIDGKASFSETVKPNSKPTTPGSVPVKTGYTFKGLVYGKNGRQPLQYGHDHQQHDILRAVCGQQVHRNMGFGHRSERNDRANLRGKAGAAN